VTGQGRNPHQRPSVTRLGVEREQRLIAEDYNKALGLLQAVVPPDLLERFEALELVVADQARLIAAQDARIASLEARPAADEDGAARSGVWCRMAEAMRRTFYSRSGLLNLCRQGKIRFDYEGTHRIIDVSSVPRKFSQRSAQSAHST
jgi:hypothetical protein